MGGWTSCTTAWTLWEWTCRLLLFIKITVNKLTIKKNSSILKQEFFLAARELQRVATALLYLIPAAGGLLRPQHVRGGRRRELPQVCIALLLTLVPLLCVCYNLYFPVLLCRQSNNICLRLNDALAFLWIE
jgi:hypothetical protein